MRVYHGTDVAVAEALAANPQLLDVTQGGGELGRGFYVSDRPGLAMSFARGRYGLRGRVLQISIDDVEYAALSRTTLDHDDVRRTSMMLRAGNSTQTHTFGRDVVEGPLATIPRAKQYKFESEKAGEVLKRSEWKVLS